MENFPGNSHSNRPIQPAKPTPEAKKVEKIVTGRVIQRKKSLGKRFAETFFSGSGSVGTYILHEILIPSIKDTIVDVFTNGVERAINGESSSGRRAAYRTVGNYVNYNRYAQPSTSNRNDPRPQLSRRARANHDFTEIVLASRREAEAVTDKLLDLLNHYGQATVADLYDMLGIQGNFAEERYGWRDIRGYKIDRVNNGYLLDLPQPEPLDQ